jgi:hypothetical protein
VTFFYRTQTLLDSTARTSVIPTNYDVGGVITVIPGAGATSTIQRVFLAPNGVIQIQYGQNLYNNLAAATAAIGTDSFIENPALISTSILIGYIVVQKNSVALNNANTAAILRAPKFETGAGGGINSVITLQQTYNSSTQPQIVLSSLGGLQIFDNSSPIGGNLFQVANNAGSINYFNVTVTGISTSGQITSTVATGTPPLVVSSTTLVPNLNVALATNVTGVVAAINGGTGQSTYTTGDTLYASATNTISKLAIGANATVLTSNGTIVSWQPASASTIGARYFSTSGGAIGTTFATVTFITKDYDTNNAYSSGIYTIPATGRYQINARTSQAATAYSLNNAAQIGIFKNGTQMNFGLNRAAAAVADMDVEVSDIINCVAGDLITIQCANNGTGPTFSTGIRAYFSIGFIGT